MTGIIYLPLFVLAGTRYHKIQYKKGQYIGPPTEWPISIMSLVISSTMLILQIIASSTILRGVFFKKQKQINCIGIIIL